MCLKFLVVGKLTWQEFLQLVKGSRCCRSTVLPTFYCMFFLFYSFDHQLLFCIKTYFKHSNPLTFRTFCTSLHFTSFTFVSWYKSVLLILQMQLNLWNVSEIFHSCFQQARFASAKPVAYVDKWGGKIAYLGYLPQHAQDQIILKVNKIRKGDYN